MPIGEHDGSATRREGLQYDGKVEESMVASGLIREKDSNEIEQDVVKILLRQDDRRHG